MCVKHVMPPSHSLLWAFMTVPLPGTVNGIRKIGEAGVKITLGSPNLAICSEANKAAMF